MILKFIYSEKAINFCEISTLDLSYVVTVKSTVEISQNFVAFSEGLKFLFQSFKVQSPPPPRQLQDVLASSDLANKFHAYLVEIDEPNEEYTSVSRTGPRLRAPEAGPPNFRG